MRRRAWSSRHLGPSGRLKRKVRGRSRLHQPTLQYPQARECAPSHSLPGQPQAASLALHWCLRLDLYFFRLNQYKAPGPRHCVNAQEGRFVYTHPCTHLSLQGAACQAPESPRQAPQTVPCWTHCKTSSLSEAHWACPCVESPSELTLAVLLS